MKKRSQKLRFFILVWLAAARIWSTNYTTPPKEQIDAGRFRCGSESRFDSPRGEKFAS